jgi:predicted transcriptional regulator of viral defense system
MPPIIHLAVAQRGLVVQSDSGDMRRRIVALLQDYPEGLTPAEIRTLLGVDRRMADTCLGMLRYGLLQRVGRGRYRAAALSRNDQ